MSKTTTREEPDNTRPVSTSIDHIIGLAEAYAGGLSYEAMARRIGMKVNQSSSGRLSAFFAVLRAVGYPLPSRPRKPMSQEAKDAHRRRMKAIWRAAREAGIISNRR